MEVAGLEHLLRKRGFLNKGWLHRLEVHRASSLLASHRFVHSLCEYGGATRRFVPQIVKVSISRLSASVAEW